MNNIKRVLVLAPHPDDGEFGCGGSLHKLTQTGAEVYYVAFSPCNKSLPAGMEKNGIYNELKNAVPKLGIKEENLTMFEYPVRDFPEYRQAILEDLIKLRNSINPDLVFLPNSDDVHQDHHQIYLEGRRAFKFHRMLGYELPWNSTHFLANFHIALNDANLEAKIDALQSYKSQGSRYYMSADFLKSLAVVRGVQSGSKYAEAFTAIRWKL